MLFEDYCPSKSCPILWFKSSEFSPMFYNEHGSLESVNELDEGGKRRDRVYELFKKFEPAIHTYIIEYLKKKATENGDSEYLTTKYVSGNILKKLHTKWIDDRQKDPIEAYFDFIDYKEILTNCKDLELDKIFKIDNRFEWMDKCNELRRDPAHTIKPPPTIEEVAYLERVVLQILPRLN